MALIPHLSLKNSSNSSTIRLVLKKNLGNYAHFTSEKLRNINL